MCPPSTTGRSPASGGAAGAGGLAGAASAGGAEPAISPNSKNVSAVTRGRGVYLIPAPLLERKIEASATQARKIGRSSGRPILLAIEDARLARSHLVDPL